MSTAIIHKLPERKTMKNLNYTILRKAVKNLILISYNKSLNIRDVYKTRPNYFYNIINEHEYAGNMKDVELLSGASENNDIVDAMSYIISSIVKKLLEEKKEPFERVINDFFNSYMCEDICDAKTGYYELSSAHLYAVYKGDIDISELL